MSRFIGILESGRRDLLDAVRDVSPEQACNCPAPGRWSVLECIEHIATAEDRFLNWILEGSTIDPQRNDDNELRIFTIVRSRLEKREAPEAVRPRGRFSTLEAALAEFNSVRDRSIQEVRERGEALYSIGVTHPRFGNMNAAELVQLMDGHARRHAEQIREICER